MRVEAPSRGPRNLELSAELTEPFAVENAQASGFLVIGKELELRVAFRALLDAVHVQNPVDVHEEYRAFGAHRCRLPVADTRLNAPRPLPLAQRHVVGSGAPGRRAGYRNCSPCWNDAM